jgi:hypothetical protein
MAELPNPWLEFLTELDAALPETVSLHCIGGFVMSYFYGLPRPTGHIDYYTAIPANLDLDGFAGRGSPLASKHKVYLQRVRVNNMPEEYETRLTEMFPKQFKHLRLFAPDAYDLVLSKIERNSGKDRDDADYLFRKLGLNAEVLKQRYQTELRLNLGRPEREDLTLKIWIEIFETQVGA